MSDKIQHECGVALIRLLKPLDFYKQKYGSSRYGLHKMYQLMDKMINRGQDGAGVATVKLDTEAGTTYIDRLRSVEPKATQDIFSQINDLYIQAKDKNPEKVNMSVGAYRDEEGKPYPFPVVKKAQKLILEDESQNFEYSPIDGDQQFNKAAR